MIDGIELLCSWFPYLVPVVALLGLWVARCSTDRQVRKIAERAFFALLIVVAGGTLRTIVAEDHCWLLHTTSFAVMVVGALVPGASTTSIEGI